MIAWIRNTLCDGCRHRPFAKEESGRLERSELSYLGSYAFLLNFLAQCRDEGCLPLEKDHYNQLVSAVEALSQHGHDQRVNCDNAHFSGFEKQVREVLPAFSIKLMPRRDSKSGEPMGHELSVPPDLGDAQKDERTRPETPQLVDPNVSVILTDQDFDGRSRGNIKHDARTLASGFMDPHPLLERYNIELRLLTCWIEAIAEKYNQVPYHSWRHAFDVFQFTYMSISVGAAHKYFNYQDLLAMFIAIIAHDVGHLGVNNNYLIQTGHQLALTYNDKSVLENMHASVCFTMLGTPGLNFLADQPKAQLSNLREKVIDAILATDMAHHFEFVEGKSLSAGDAILYRYKRKKQALESAQAQSFC